MLTGVDIDRAAVNAARGALGPDATLSSGMRCRLAGRRARSTSLSATRRSCRSSPPPPHGAADRHTAAVHMRTPRSSSSRWRCVSPRPDGGRVGLVLPTSVVATRDATAVRREVLQHARPLVVLVVAHAPSFDAQVRTCAVALVCGATGRLAPRRIRRLSGPDFRTCPAVSSAAFRQAVAETGSWSALLRDEGAAPRCRHSRPERSPSPMWPRWRRTSATSTTGWSARSLTTSAPVRVRPS